jgi:heme exporter protein D
MRIDLGFSVVGDNASKETYYINITREEVVKRIKSHPSIDPWTKDNLVRRVNDYPDNALVYFVKNINQIVVSAINERNRILKEENARQHQEERQRQEENRQSETDFTGELNIGSGGTGVNEVEEEPKEEERESLFSRRSSS